MKPLKADTSPGYWDNYTNLQFVKHALIHKYLNGWLPRLGRWHDRILYIDTHAGRGKHASGQFGSPIVALNTYLDHRYRANIFGACEAKFYFIEIDQANCDALHKEIDKIGHIPDQVKFEIICEDYYSALRSMLDNLKAAGTKLAPAFVFIDPYGFKVPLAILSELMKYERVELFVNIIWRELSMAIAQGNEQQGMADALCIVFGDESWKDLIGLEYEEQAEECVNLLRRKIGAKWATYIKMLGKNRCTRYMLLHLTNHDAGRDLIKECLWSVCPEAGIFARATDDPKQQVLIKPTPDFTPLRQWVLSRLRKEPQRWQELMAQLRNTMWKYSHLNDIIRELHREGVIDGRRYRAVQRFVPKQDPELFLLERKKRDEEQN